MTSGKAGPTLGKSSAREMRKQRLAAALRENLRKRKIQSRERAASDQPISSKPKQF